MIRLAALLSLALCVGEAQAADPLEVLRGEGYASAAAVAKALPIGPKDSAWEKAAPISLLAYPQSTVKPGLAEDGAAPLKMELRVLAKGRELAVRLSWPDAAIEPWRTDRTDSFADAAALQFALPGREGTLPYIGMGEPDRPVDLWLWRNGRETEKLSAHGFGTLERQPGKSPDGDALWENGTWRVVLTGTIPNKAGPLLALSAAIWNGGDAGRDGRKRHTAWHLITFPGARTNSKVLSGLVKEGTASGTPERGKNLAEEHGCPGCHRVAGGDPVETGPDLTLAGGQHWPGYLRRSVKRPSSFLVPVDRFAEEGNLTSGKSLMPSLDLSDQDVEDLVAYLRSMK
ncbi:MAG: c-type cytochrome [Rhodospirillales bacterium]|nr:c-type cytochrome [Rhodospirillales bacterium]